MSYIDPQTYLQKMSSKDNLVNSQVIERRAGAGRRIGQTNIPPAMRLLVAVAAKLDNPNKAAKAFGVSQVTAQNTMKGVDNNQQPKNDGIKEKADNIVADAKERALSIVMKSLNFADDEGKIEELTIGKQVQLAKDASAIVEKLTDKSNQGSAAQVIIYTAPERDLGDYGEPIIINSK